MRKFLLVAYHFPPVAGSSGLLRSLKFCRYLPETGWLPVVLTAHPRVYERTEDSQLVDIPPSVEVIRAFALSTRKHLALRGHYFKWMALPDAWVTWCIGAVARGVYAICRKRLQFIFTTFPIATAILIGYLLHVLTGLPWILDLRDPLTEDEYPVDPTVRRVCLWIETKAIQHGSLFVFTAASTQDMYLKRYPGLDPTKTVVLPNGFDEQDFANLVFPQNGANETRPLRLVHSGTIYPHERDPRSLFQALGKLKAQGSLNGTVLRVDLRASGCEADYQKMIGQLGIEDMVYLLPPLPYRQSLQDAAQADGLLLLQGPPCNHQIPAKLYEYMRLGKPVLALTPPISDTAKVARQVGGFTVVDIQDETAIQDILPRFLESVRLHQHPLPDPTAVSVYGRKNQARQLAEIFDNMFGSRS